LCSILELVRTHFAACGGEEVPPAKIRKGGGAAPLTISSFSLAALNPRIRKANTNVLYEKY
jgi:hypothetical protein